MHCGASSAWCETNSSWVAPLADQHVDEATHQLAIERIQPLQRLVEDQQRRVFHQRAGDQRQPLLAP